LQVNLSPRKVVALAFPAASALILICPLADRARSPADAGENAIIVERAADALGCAQPDQHTHLGRAGKRIGKGYQALHVKLAIRARRPFNGPDYEPE